MNVIKFSVKNGDEEVKYFVRKPRHDESMKAQFASARMAKEAIKNGAMSREELESWLRKQGEWNDELQKEAEELENFVRDGIEQLIERGGRTKEGEPFSKEDAKKLAVEMKIKRFQLALMRAKHREMDEFTVEGIAENTKFETLVTLCSFYEPEEGEQPKRVFESVEDYLANAEEEYAVKCATKMSTLMHGFNEDYQKDWPENKFLLEHGFVNENLELIDEESKEEEKIKFVPFD